MKCGNIATYGILKENTLTYQEFRCPYHSAFDFLISPDLDKRKIPNVSQKDITCDYENDTQLSNLIQKN